MPADVTRMGYGPGLNVETWDAALLATAAVWPTRAITGRWPVVAYRIDDDGRDVRWTADRESAGALVRRWAADIKRDGTPHRSMDALDVAS